jgi:hypothetical protein
MRRSKNSMDSRVGTGSSAAVIITTNVIAPMQLVIVNASSAVRGKRSRSQFHDRYAAGSTYQFNKLPACLAAPSENVPT